MELEGAIKVLEDENQIIYDFTTRKFDEKWKTAYKTVIEIAKNSIPKSILRHKIQELEYDQLENTGNVVEDRIKINFIKDLLEGK